MLVREDSDEATSWISFLTAFSFRQTKQTIVGHGKRLLSLKISPLCRTQTGFECASQNTQKVITLSIFGRHHPPCPFSPHSPTRFLKQGSDVSEKANTGPRTNLTRGLVSSVAQVKKLQRVQFCICYRFFLPSVSQPSMEGVGYLSELLPQIVIVLLTLSFLAQIILTLLNKKIKITILWSSSGLK